MPFIKLDDLDEMHKITFNKCLHNYKIYSMDTLNSQNEYNELEMILIFNRDDLLSRSKSKIL